VSVAPVEEQVDEMEPDEGELGLLGQLQRVSGLLLVPLALVVFVHAYLIHDVAELTALDFERRWSNPVLQLADWSFLLLAVAHGLVGWHWFLGRHLRSDGFRNALEGVTTTVVVLAFLYGSIAVFS
jgi:succinate dehydrogenase hydrophobic anchor subunit